MGTKYIEQFVRTNAFLVESQIALGDLEKGENVIAILPPNHVLMGVDIEVIEEGKGTCDVGVKGNANVFISGVDLATKKNTISAIRLSSEAKTYSIVLDVKEEQDKDKGKIIFRMQYFGNQVRMVDFTIND